MSHDEHTPPVLRLGFRPFFFVAALWSVVAMLAWLPLFGGNIALPTAFDPVAWHIHEMLFGYAGAVVAGFLLTAIPNWTGRLPLQGTPLATLVVFWLAGRIAVAVSLEIGPPLAALIDLSFPAVFLCVVTREVVAGRNWRNLPMPLALTALIAANALMHAEALNLAGTGALGQRLGIAALVLLISLIGGRVVPSFTRNWLARRGEIRMPVGFGDFDRICVLLVLAAMIAWTFLPENPIGGALLIAAGLASLIRLVRWRAPLTTSEPLVWSLHLGFAWVPVGLVLTGLATPLANLPAAAGLHALTAGAIGAMTLAMMTRASLGHSGRELAADRITTAIYLLVFAAALIRVAAPFVDNAWLTLLWVSAACWIAAFGLFAIHYAPILLTPGKR